MALRRVVAVTSPATAPDAPSDNLPAPGAYDLVDFPTVLGELGVNASDPNLPLAWMARAVTDVSLRIRDYCNRVFQVEGLSELLILDGGSGLTPGTVAPLTLSRWPVANAVSLLAAAEADSGAVLTFTSTAGVAAGMPASHRAIPPGTTVASLTPTTVTLSAPLSTNPTAALATKVLAGDAVVFGLSVARILATGQSPYLPVSLGLLNTGPLPAQSLGPYVDYLVDSKIGRLIRLNPFDAAPCTWDTFPTWVNYSAGYPAIPDDIAGAALEWISWRYYERKRGDPALKTRTQPELGTETWWVGGPPSSGGVPESIRGVLDHYRVPVAG
ncbi:MAG TPA: hypothetical protein VMS01_04260 [Stellaceae bacterium]|nr:hypothetical protein [Stellaceae bacterium]